MVLVMVCGFTAIATAEEGTYETTRAIIATLEEHGFHCYLDGFTSSGRERISITYEYSTGLTVPLCIMVDESGETVGIRMWKLIQYDPADLPDVVALCNKLNLSTVFATFCADEEDNTVTVTLDVVIKNSSNCGEIVYEALDWVLTAVKDRYPEFAPFAR